MTEPLSTAAPAELGEDTMELELTAEEQLELTAEAQCELELSAEEQCELEAVDAQGPMAPDYETYIRTRTSRIDLAGTVTFVVLILGGLSIAGWRTLHGAPRPVAIAYQSPQERHTATLAAPPQPTFVRVANPFDAGEVFEIPADMTEAEARDAVAQALLSRARERVQQGIRLQSLRRTRVSAIVAGGSTDIVVTPVPRPVTPMLD